MPHISIAIIDDDSITLEAMSICLMNQLGQDVSLFTFNNPLDFVSKMSTIPHLALAVVDLEMPEKSGVEVIQEIKSYQGSIPIIVLTGNTQVLKSYPEVQPYIFELLVKPVEYKQLVRAIKDGLAVSEFFSPSTLPQEGMDDEFASRRIYQELLDIHYDIKQLLIHPSPDLVELSKKLDDQYRLIHLLLSAREDSR